MTDTQLLIVLLCSATLIFTGVTTNIRLFFIPVDFFIAIAGVAGVIYVALTAMGGGA